MSSGSTASVTPEEAARLRTAERSAWSWVAFDEVQGTTALTREAETWAPESHTRIERSLPEYSPELADTVTTRGPHSVASVKGRRMWGYESQRNGGPAGSIGEGGGRGVRGVRFVLGECRRQCGHRDWRLVGDKYLEEIFASVVGESFRTVPETITSFSLVMMRGDSELIEG